MKEWTRRNWDLIACFTRMAVLAFVIGYTLLK
jgi:hypothetical protein